MDMHARVSSQKLAHPRGFVGRKIVRDDVNVAAPRLTGNNIGKKCDKLFAGMSLSGFSQRMVCGRSLALAHTRATIMWLTPRCLASLRVLQWVEPSGGLLRVALRILACIAGVQVCTALPRCREYRPAIRSAKKRLFQRST